ncbi:hypothetical protein RRG08_023436 [Elysia crispata]|uniref:Gamma-glutamyltranspeptidase 1 n=1 Tax=Elysia crispata TaxID=231223 RepID=A0AAE1DWX2_9GAST|nr:hypothetical protein RRG08_023436 [Elysia crispata]
MEYEPFLGEEPEDDIFTMDMNSHTTRIDRAKRKRVLTFSIIGMVGIFVLLAGGLVIAARQRGTSHTSLIPSQLQHDTGENNMADEAAHQNENPTKLSEKLHRYKSASVASDSAECSSVGKHILLQGGNAVDAAIASLLCLGLTDPQSMGIGGGFFMTIYNSTSGKATAIDARETAPMNASAHMFNGNRKLASSGPLSIAVPAEVKGYWHAHKHYGHLPWSKLFEPAIKMAQDGFPVPIGLHHAIEDDKELLSTEPSLKEIFINRRTGKLFRYKEIMHRPQLAKTLKIISGEDMDSLSASTLLKNVVADLEDIGAIVTKDDLVNYKVLEKKPIETTLDDGLLRVISPPPPSSGVVLSFILNLLNGYNLDPHDIASLEGRILTYHRNIEAFKFAYAKRTALGDEDFVDVKELVANLTSKTYANRIRQLITDNSTHDYQYYGPSFYTPKTSGTSHMSVIDQNGNAVSVTSTINGRFGARLRGRRTGIIWNNEMDDFSAPNITNEFGLLPSEANFIEGGKRPLSSMCPAVVVRDSHIKLIVGAAGGSLITSTTAWVVEHNLWLGKNIQEAIDSHRLHHQLLPPEAKYEEGFEKAVIQGLRLKGHNFTAFAVGKSIAQGIDISSGWITAASDYRKGGSPDGF